MKFGLFPVREGEGLILAHSIRGAIVLRKGHVLSQEDVTILEKCGFTEVYGAALESDDVKEDVAAAEIANLLIGPGIRASAAHTGRCNLIATENGLFVLDESAINRANEVEESITIATLPNHAVVKAGQIIATVKIIPFAVKAADLAQAKERLASVDVRVARFRSKKIAVVSTLLAGLKPTVITATEDVIRGRIEEVGGTLFRMTRVPHDADSVAQEIRTAATDGAQIILIVGASATCDRRDVVPAGVVAAGGSIEHFGMPVDPGNLLLLARIGSVPVVVLPGCARSAKLNGADWVMRRLAADIPVARRDIMRMGVGGLLLDTPLRPLPRAQAVEDRFPSQVPRIAAVILAAGQSRRMGGRNKLLMEVGGVPLVRRTALSVVASPVTQVVVVTGHERERVEAAVRDLRVKLVHNADFKAGLSTSLKAALDAVSSEADGVVVCLGDMPCVSHAHLERLIEGFSPAEGREIGLPVHRGKRGNPVLWGRRFFPEIREIAGDVGARHLVGANESLVYEVEFDDTGVLMDLDTPDQWADFDRFVSSTAQ